MKQDIWSSDGGLGGGEQVFKSDQLKKIHGYLQHCSQRMFYIV